MNDILISDLTHTYKGINSSYFPLGAAYVASYAKKTLGSKFNVKLFKFPENLIDEIKKIDKPIIIGCSCYSWNLELSVELCKWIKEEYPESIIIFGGPNFPYDKKEKLEFLQSYPVIDFFIQGEGEIAFSELIEILNRYNFNIDELKNNEEIIQNCNYLKGDSIVSGLIERIIDVDKLESPYTSGLMDKFFKYHLKPMLETTRGCPFRCTYCADGVKLKCRITHHTIDRVKEEIDYIISNVRYSDNLVITDLNFGMYKEDIQVAKYIACVIDKTNWPKEINGTSGKNNISRIKEVMKILKGRFLVGSSIQSNDIEVLRNIKRDNISQEVCEEFIKFNREINENSYTYTEIILGLPGDTLEKHFKSMKYGIDNRVDNIKSFQAIMLIGTDMSSNESRRKYNIDTRYRVIPGCFGKYRFGKKEVNIAELEEIITSTDTLSFDDYINCRVFDLLIEVYYNNSVFEELLRPLDTSQIYDLIIHLYNNRSAFRDDIDKLIDEFKYETIKDTYNSKRDAIEYINTPEVFQQYIDNKLGRNELMTYKVLFFNKIESSIKTMVEVINKMYGYDRDYLVDVGKFIVCRKKLFYREDKDIVKEFRYNIDKHLLKNTTYRFFHTDKQRGEIKKLIELYDKNTGGVGRMFQKSNMKEMYRKYEIK